MESSQTDLDWQNGQPYSNQFGDIYFSSESGLAESQYVFLQHNRLAERWARLSSAHFCIAETGFGTGLNFLTAWDLWSKTAPNQARLNFISIEKYPLNPHD
ncbi:MAG: bifunctional tRNA (5-methylaminomethyl-2-thiouridine)(34)-methyltransferase MnmD/FAD-dependent 5-carboxymethylaminomethyl-2-thiouridine(34) oxidoreductase MnmC, partial [Nitrosomonadales bacterium]|nr:bifunctional tRNA (5-methylaminomethyl-2-thiouridine)(34)-methyltransferase MnmD/FAD-dependent 5-carboxymethylaminomethyl-2-thiouridine(34) oxidoreductase MnmC [Nitrosomonadales bacterium]